MSDFGREWKRQERRIRIEAAVFAVVIMGLVAVPFIEAALR